jgi:YebC/PmpR family DNA-binding regulatory protein
MSGHSKWSSIKHKKGAADAKRGKLFSKLSRGIIVAAREGGPDPAGNLALQNAIEKARSYSMPKDNIERAIARGSGADSDATSFEQILYEGYGPNGIALMVEALTDNRNRTASEVRHLFAKHDGNLGATGAVAWLFERQGVILVPGSVDEDELTLAAAEGGAEDVGGDRSRGSSGRLGRADDGPEDHGRGRGGGRRPQGAQARGRPGGGRRRPERLRELRHPRADARGRRLLVGRS